MKCFYCEKEYSWLTTDHIVPVSLGGINLPKNKVAACFRCNQLKGPLMPQAFIQKLESMLDETPYGHEYDRIKIMIKNTKRLDEYVKSKIQILVK